MGILLSPVGARATAIQFDTDNPSAQKACLDQGEKDGYLIRYAGDVDSSAPGARLWDLGQLARAPKDGDDCTSQLFKQGLADQTEYWKYIAEKYSCDKSNSGSESSQCELYQKNDAYLGAILHIVSDPWSDPRSDPRASAAGCDPSSSGVPGRPQVNNLATDVASAAVVLNPTVKPISQYCKNNVPPNQLRSPNDPDLSVGQAIGQNAKDCVLGVWDFIHSLWKQGAGLVDAVKKPGFFHGMALFSEELARNPSKIVSLVQRYVEGTLQYFIGDMKDIALYHSCYKPGIVAQKACSQGAKWLLAYGVGRFAIKPLGSGAAKVWSGAKGGTWKAVSAGANLTAQQALRVPGVAKAVNVAAPVVKAVVNRAAAAGAAAKSVLRSVPETKSAEPAPALAPGAAPKAKWDQVKSLGSKTKKLYQGSVRGGLGATVPAAAVEKKSTADEQDQEKSIEKAQEEKMKREEEDAEKRQLQIQSQQPAAQPATQ